MKTEIVKHTQKELERLLHIADKNGIFVSFIPLRKYDARLMNEEDEIRIGIRINMNFDEYVYNLAHELAHYFLHYDKGDTVTSDKHEEYEEQADRAARMLLLAVRSAD